MAAGYADFCDLLICLERYTGIMALGWERKSVEDQICAAEAAKEARAKPHLSAEQRELKERKQSLLLSRAQILARLKSATNPKYRSQLQAALDHLDAELKSMSGTDFSL